MKVSVQFTIFMAALFAILCFSVAATGFAALGEIADPAIASDARGYAWFWMFLGIIAVAVGALGVWLVRTPK